MSEREQFKLHKRIVDESYEAAGIGPVDETEEERTYNNLLDGDGFEVNPGIIQDCAIWLTGGSVKAGWRLEEGDDELRKEYLTFNARFTLFGNTKPTIIRYDVPESCWDRSGEQALRWGVVELVNNFRLQLDEQVNKILNDEWTK